ncbi:AAEL007927-PA [Aedes aegypti]|uniref:AAEL007927-PA n=1 Tax=Aedes aegypti TaxID=7159 RepID=Q170G7_AEDAE|nr:AAEL007927-PA [Aedes aegypti]
MKKIFTSRATQDRTACRMWPAGHTLASPAVGTPSYSRITVPSIAVFVSSGALLRRQPQSLVKKERNTNQPTSYVTNPSGLEPEQAVLRTVVEQYSVE